MRIEFFKLWLVNVRTPIGEKELYMIHYFTARLKHSLGIYRSNMEMRMDIEDKST